MIAQLLVGFYRFWHGRLHLKGAGTLIYLFRNSISGLHDFPVALPDGTQIRVDFRDVSGVYWLNHLLGERFEEKGLLMAVQSKVTKDTVIWDVGANCGLFSYLLARSTDARQIFFYEPNRKMFTIASAATSSFSKVKGIFKGLSDREGRVTLRIPDGHSTMGTLEPDQASGRSEEVEIASADSLVEKGEAEAPHIIKIDTEGHELKVLAGMKKLISEKKPLIFFEHISLKDQEIFDAVPDGYEVCSVDDEDGSISVGFDRSKGHNSLLQPKG